MRPSDIRSGFDTSVLMRLLVGEPEALFKQATAYLADTQKLRKRILISNLVICEAYFACQHHYQMPKHLTLRGLHQLFSKSVFEIEEGVLSLIGTRGMERAKPGFVDRLIHSEYIKQGVGMVTCEKAASKLINVDILK